jgi:hypothetical protein
MAAVQAVGLLDRTMSVKGGSLPGRGLGRLCFSALRDEQAYAKTSQLKPSRPPAAATFVLSRQALWVLSVLTLNL